MSSIPFLTGPQNAFDIADRLNRVILQINAGLDAELDATLAQGNIYVGNAGNVPVGQNMSGGAAINESGVVTINVDGILIGGETF